MKVSDLTIARRLGIGFLVVVLSMIALTAVGVTRVNQISERLTVINDLNSVKQRYAINFRGSVHDRAISLRDVVLAETLPQVRPEIVEIERLSAKYAESAAKMADIFADPEKVSDDEAAAMADIARIEQQTLPLIQQVVALRTAGDTANALDVLVRQAKPLFVDWLRAINVLIDLEESMNQGETAQARSVAGGFLQTMALICAIAILIAVLVAWGITRGITRPLAEAATVLAAVADGDLTRRLNVRGRDEVAQMGRSMNTALSTLGEVMTAFAHSADGLNSASSRIGGLSRQIASGAEASSAQANVVAAAAGEISRSVQTVAAGTHEMGESIQDIARNANEAATVAGRAVTSVETTTTTVSRLGESSRMIGDVVKVISSIAEQTNLLALNATIEAARAGESGKGFAVVANEVKELSQETARATGDISRRVEAIQADTTSAVTAIAEVSDVITQMNNYQTIIASAVEEQTATTNEMNRSVAEAAAGSGQIATNIVGVADVAQATSESVAESLRAADELSGVSAELQTLVARFRF